MMTKMLLIFILILIGLVFGFFLWGILDKTAIENYDLQYLISTFSTMLAALAVTASLLVVLEMQRDREMISKPSIFAGFDFSGGVAKFVIRNDGKSNAQNIKVDIDPIPIGFNNEPINNNVTWFTQPIRTLLPGEKLEMVLGSQEGVFQDGVPNIFIIRCKYSSLMNKAYSEKPYTINIKDYRNSSIPARSIDESLNIIAEKLK